VLCSKFVKFGRRKIVKSCVAYRTKKRKFRLALQLSLLRGSRPMTVSPRQCTHVLRVLQISSKSVHFRRGYIQTREHRQSKLESESNIRLKPRFELNNKRKWLLSLSIACDVSDRSDACRTRSSSSSAGACNVKTELLQCNTDRSSTRDCRTTTTSPELSCSLDL